jgi:hypothetical protein
MGVPAGSLLTVAVKDAVLPDATVPKEGDTETVIVGTVTVIVPFLVMSATEVTVIVTVRSLAGGAGGAVYVVGAPLAVLVGETEPHCDTEHETIHVTPLLAESFLTVAVNCTVPPALTVAETKERAMLIGFEPPLQPANPNIAATTSKQQRVRDFMSSLRFLRCRVHNLKGGL